MAENHFAKQWLQMRDTVEGKKKKVNGPPICCRLPRDETDSPLITERDLCLHLSVGSTSGSMEASTSECIPKKEQP